jgi:1-pyrroline-2-carboxylate reductase [NAD(P)H]
MKVLSADHVHAALEWPALIETLQHAYAGDFTMPQRQVMRLNADPENHDAFALLPAWNDEIIAVKAFTYFPENPPPHPSLHAQILMFSRQHGEPLALIDGTSVTLWRTAGISALASRLLSRGDSETLLLLGTGRLAPFLIRAHAAARPLQRVLVWGRDAEKARALVDRMSAELPTISFETSSSIESACAVADVVVSATGSPDILVRGAWIRPGTHVDLLGNHHAGHRECDTELVTRAEVYVDTFINCLKEAGEILIPIEEGVFSRDALRGELADLCAGRVPGCHNPGAITLFKSVGAALGDLATAHAVLRAHEEGHFQ